MAANVRAFDIACLADKLVGVTPTGQTRARYIDITEGRESKGSFYYGWCGDFATYVCMLAGCRSGQILNRAALNGKWTPGDNIERLRRWAVRASAWVPYDAALKMVIQPGWLYIRQRKDGDHIGVVLGRAATGVMKSVDGNSYGNAVARNRWEETPIIRGYINTDLLPTTVGLEADSDQRALLAVLADETPLDNRLADTEGGDGPELDANLLV